MAHRIFGWDLPPGCTSGDIERAYGDQPTHIEAYELAQKGNLSPTELEVLARIYDDEEVADLVDKIACWAREEGRSDEAREREMERAMSGEPSEGGDADAGC